MQVNFVFPEPLQVTNPVKVRHGNRHHSPLCEVCYCCSSHLCLRAAFAKAPQMFVECVRPESADHGFPLSRRNVRPFETKQADILTQTTPQRKNLPVQQIWRLFSRHVCVLMSVLIKQLLTRAFISTFRSQSTRARLEARMCSSCTYKINNGSISNLVTSHQSPANANGTLKVSFY